MSLCLPSRADAAQRSVIDLSANENPLGPSPKVANAIMASLDRLHRYPDKDGSKLRAALASKLGVAPRQIVLGNGSCEIIELAARACLAPGDEAIIAVPSFLPYQSAVERAHGRKVLVRLRNHHHDLNAMLERVNSRTRLVIIGNPNNPTGTTVGGSALAWFLDRLPEEVLVVLDEAYFEYVQREDFPASLEYVNQERPVLVLRSLSKAYGLAGLRIGYAVAPAHVVRRADAMRQHFNTNALAQVAAIAALEDEAHLRRSVAHCTAAKSYMYRALDTLGFDHVRSEANFLLLRVGGGEDVRRLLEQRGILVKGMTAFGLPEYIRVSAGLAEDNEYFIDALRRIFREYQPALSVPIDRQ
ncbi:MAG: histidinol-phosphate transaminase [Pseudomonadota bacterium]